MVLCRSLEHVGFFPGTSASFHTNDPLALTPVSMRDDNKSCKINKVQFSKSPKENVSKLNSSGKKPPLILVYKEEMQLISQNFSQIRSTIIVIHDHIIKVYQ